jgi:hypothetical protein
MELSWSVFRPAVVEGLMCYGPDCGTQVTFVRVDQWLPKLKAISESKAQQLLLRRYLAAYGPATLQDFSKWSGIPSKDTRPIWDSLKDDLTEVRVGEKKAWTLRENLKQLSTSSLDDETVRLLPSFDPYMLAHSDKTHFLDPHHYKRVYRGAGWLSPVVLVNGRVAGTWSTQRRGSRLFLEVEPFEKLSKSIRTKVEEEAATLGIFYGIESDVRFLSAATPC